MRPDRLLQVAVFFVVALSSSPVGAQSMTPMRGVITSFADEFAVRVFPRNTYRHQVEVAVRVYDENFRPVRARTSPSTMMLTGGASRPVVVVIPFEGMSERRVRICTESIPFPDGTTRIKAQICGRFLARRLR
ncbi:MULTISPECIES: hypothetical protein [Chelativorans]|jgi:hypothetical protein|uniref:Uncharacterized protein n=1 Tax=Chelativorans sp. (strain BNC1) TaxID=266779 RepID=Q11IS4_CHESB|nr:MULTISPECIES: hypothetical protein [Chelativorans]